MLTPQNNIVEFPLLLILFTFHAHTSNKNWGNNNLLTDYAGRFSAADSALVTVIKHADLLMKTKLGLGWGWGMGGWVGGFAPVLLCGLCARVTPCVATVALKDQWVSKDAVVCLGCEKASAASE